MTDIYLEFVKKSELAWNETADEHNQWSVISGEERSEAICDLMADEIERLRAELDKQKWQPISEAPKNGTKILGALFSGFYNSFDFSVVMWNGETWKVSPTKDGRLSFMATHWMPLPKGPDDE